MVALFVYWRTRLITVDALPYYTIHKVKTQIHDKGGPPPEQQKLSLDFVELQSDRTLKSYNIVQAKTRLTLYAPQKAKRMTNKAKTAVKAKKRRGCDGDEGDAPNTGDDGDADDQGDGSAELVETSASQLGARPL